MGELVKVLIVGGEAGVSLNAQFNPKELQVDKSVSWTNAKGPATEDPEQEFKEPQSRSLSTTLYFDTYETGGDVYGQYVSKLEKLVTIVGGLGRPPLVTFTWGSFTFQGVVESLSQKYTMFLSNGTRCRCEVGFKMKSASAAKVATQDSGGGGGAS